MLWSDSAPVDEQVSTLIAIVVDNRRPKHTTQCLCLDKGYDYREVEAASAAAARKPKRNDYSRLPATALGCGAHLQLAQSLSPHPHPLGKELENYLAMLHLACASIAFRAATLSG